MTNEENPESEKKILPLSSKIEAGITKIDGLWSCTYCSRTFSQKGGVKDHVETHFEGFSHTCNICYKSARTTKALKKHVERIHHYSYSTYLKFVINQDSC